MCRIYYSKNDNNIAYSNGYTQQVYAVCQDHELSLLCKPDADLDGRFIAWCCDEQEYLHVNGWLYVYEVDSINC